MENLKVFLLFIIVVLLIYGSTNFYIYKRVMQAASLSGTARTVLMAAFIFFVIAFPLGRTLGESNIFGRVFIWIGAFWLGVMFYGFLIALLIDLARGIDLFTGWLPDWFLNNRVYAGRLLLALAGVGMVVLFTAGRINAVYPVVREHQFEVPMPGEVSEYNIAVISDIHLGVLVGPKQLKRIVTIVNDIGADIILVAGDLIDENPGKLNWATEILNQLEAGDGVWAVTGNHEFYSGVERSKEFIEASGMTLLRNESVEIPDGISLIGLDDQTAGREFNASMPSVKEIIGGCKSDLPRVLLHHTPRRMKEAADADVDVMVSGHSHAGQLWPTRYIVRAIFGVPQGLTYFERPDREKMFFYLLNGTGNWGPPIRVGAKPDILQLTLINKSKASGD